MIINGFDVEAFDLDGFASEIAPGVMYQGWFGDHFAHYAPAGHPDGRVGRFTVPAGVAAITFQLFGALGGALYYTPYDPDDYQTPVMHTRRFAVTPGDEIVMAAGGPPSGYDNFIPTRGNSPVWGGMGWQVPPYIGVGPAGAWAGFAGGGASAIWVNGSLVTLSPGGGGWAIKYATSSPVVRPPSATYSTGSAGAISIGTPQAWVALDPDPEGLDGGAGGGGGGAPGGAGGSTIGFPGENGSSVPIDADSDGPPSPTWAETTLGSGDYHGGAASAVRVFYYTPRSGGWAIDETRF